MDRFLLAVAVAAAFAPMAHAQAVLQDFELEQGNWFADNGVWEVGTPTFGPSECHQSTQCAGTILGGQYPFTNSRLVSPPVQLNAGSPQDPLLLRFWHWFEWGGPTGGNPDQGVVQLSVYDDVLSEWSDWVAVSSTFSGSSSVWTLNIVDLTGFSNELVKVAFYHQGRHALSTGAGWYVDDVEIPGTQAASSLFTILQDFELGQGDWFADNGIWEVGTPTSEPSGCYQGTQCAGTILDGQYPFSNSRLISPPMRLHGGTITDPLLLRFWHWFEWGGATGGNPDQGEVQLSVYDEVLEEWSDWFDVSTSFTSASGTWTLTLVDLTAYSGELAKVGFYHQGAHALSTGAGWYVDEIGITGIIIFTDGFESGDTSAWSNTVP
jgi:hypothetical protein